MLSVLVTSYNQKDVITKTVDALVNQVTDYKYNIIVSDDLSPDGSFDYLTSYYQDNEIVKIVKPNEKKKVGHNRNTLIKHADQKYSCFVDGDDVQSSDFIEKICSSIDDGDIYKLKTFTEVWSDDNLVVKNALDYENIFLNVYKTSVLKTMQFNPDIKIGEDVLFSLMYNETLLNYEAVIDVNYDLNRRDDNISLTKNGSYVERFELEKMILELFIPYESMNDYTKHKVNQKKMDVINYSFIAKQKTPMLDVDASYLPKKHKISYYLYKILPRFVYSIIIHHLIAHKL